MNESEDSTRVLQEIFDADFYPKLGVASEEMVELLEDFYDHVFPTLAQYTRPKPDAVPFIDWAFSYGYRIAIATDPLFPRKATYHRLRWAGLDPDRFESVADAANAFEHRRVRDGHVLLAAADEHRVRLVVLLDGLEQQLVQRARLGTWPTAGVRLRLRARA